MQHRGSKGRVAQGLARALVITAGLMLVGCGQSGAAVEAARVEKLLAAEKAAKYAPRPFNIGPDVARQGDVIAKPGDFIIYPNTVFCGLGIMDPAVAKVINPADPDKVMKSFPIRTGADDHRIEAIGLHFGTTRDWGFYAARPSDVARLASDCADNGINIMMTHHVGLNAQGSPYRVTMTARQGHRFWVSSITRNDGDTAPEVFAPYGGDTLHLRVDKDSIVLNKLFQRVIFGEQ